MENDYDPERHIFQKSALRTTPVFTHTFIFAYHRAFSLKTSRRLTYIKPNFLANCVINGAINPLKSTQEVVSVGKIDHSISSEYMSLDVRMYLRVNWDKLTVPPDVSSGATSPLAQIALECFITFLSKHSIALICRRRRRLA